jgi:hypothetical protein
MFQYACVDRCCRDKPSQAKPRQAKPTAHFSCLLRAAADGCVASLFVSARLRSGLCARTVLRLDRSSVTSFVPVLCRLCTIRADAAYLNTFIVTFRERLTRCVCVNVV